MSMDRRHEVLLRAARRHGTPLYVYDADLIKQRFALLTRLFGRQFRMSYAVKANPNLALLALIEPHVASFDISSYKEFERARQAGCAARRMTFSGPAKRPEELRAAIAQGLGELVLEQVAEARIADGIAAELGRRQEVLIRINPALSPKRFGASFAGRPSQFGIDEEDLEDAIDAIRGLPGLLLKGFHIFSGTNSLDVEAIATNFRIFATLFRRAALHAGLKAPKLIFGSGFGLPYWQADTALDLEALAARLLPLMDELRSEPLLEDAECVLEMGRWPVGAAGWLLTSVVAEKASRGVDFRLCDAGFNNHLAACGMLGTVIRRNWRLHNLSNPEGAPARYTVAGPLCTSIDLLACDITLPQLRVGDVIAVENSGAYGLTASPTRFISHPEPREVLIADGVYRDISESAANHWSAVDARGFPRAAARAALAMAKV